MHRVIAVVFSLLLLSLPSYADIQFNNSNQAGGLNNLDFDSLINVNGIASTVRGHLAGSSAQVDVRGNEQLTLSNGDKIQAADGKFTVADIFLSPPSPGTFARIVFALKAFDVNRGNTPDAFFTIAATQGNGSVSSQSFSLTQGTSHFSVIATNGSDIRSIQLAASTGAFERLSQVQLGNPIVSTTFAANPEPGSIVLLGSVALVALALQRKRSASNRRA